VEAVVTDPPYGIAKKTYLDKGSIGRPRTTFRNGNPLGRCQNRRWPDTNWDNEPPSNDLLVACIAKGRYAIVFGGNYFDLPPTPCMFVWDKMNDGTDFADAELAWTNLKTSVRIKRYMWNGLLIANRGSNCFSADGYERRGYHPTQKPLGVMEWCLERLPVRGGTVLDPFMGSGTTGVAALRMGFRFIGVEREADYFGTACRRIAAAAAEYGARLDFGGEEDRTEKEREQ